MSAKSKNTISNSRTNEQCTSMEKGDFISFDYEVVDSDDPEYMEEVPEVSVVQEKKEQTDEMIKGKDIVERLAWLLRCGEGDVRPKSTSTMENPTVSVILNVKESDAYPGKSTPMVEITESPEIDSDPSFLIYSDSSSDSEKHNTVIEKTITAPFQVPNNSPIPTSAPPFSSETTNFPSESLNASDPYETSDDEEPAQPEFLKHLSTTTATTTISKPISCVRFPVRLNQPPVQRIHRKLPNDDLISWQMFEQRKNAVKRIGLTGIYGMLFLVMFTALALPEMQCL